MKKPIVSQGSLLENLREKPKEGIAFYNRKYSLFDCIWGLWNAIYWILMNLTLGPILKFYLEATTE